MSDHAFERLRQPTEGPEVRLWLGGLIRIIVLCIVAAGTFLPLFEGVERVHSVYLLLLFYAVGLTSGIAYLVLVRRTDTPLPLVSRVQALIDLAVVCGTVELTGRAESFFAFLFVVVILETGLLLSVRAGFVAATLAAIFMCGEVCLQVFSGARNVGFPENWGLWYNYLIEALAFYLTAFISGYWSQRIHQLQLFQREIMDNLNTGFLVTDSNAIIRALNKAGERILCLQGGEAIGRPVEEILRVRDGGECPVLTALRAEADFTSYEFSAVAKGDTVKLLGLTTSRRHDARNRLTGIIASFSDLTEMARMREELQRQDRMAVVGELAAGLAHEIRNPVTAITGAVDELRLHIASPKTVERLAAIAIRESRHLNEIVSGFLNFARKPRVVRQTVDVRSIIEEVAALIRHEYRDATELAIKLDCPNVPCKISADRSQMKQVFVNLAINAAEAMEKKGTVAISVLPERGSVEVRFEDDGPGVEPDKVARIFEPFYTTKKSGVGMGLAVCLRIVTAHDGTIRATLREKGGTRMSVRLPAARAEE